MINNYATLEHALINAKFCLNNKLQLSPKKFYMQQVFYNKLTKISLICKVSSIINWKKTIWTIRGQKNIMVLKTNCFDTIL